MESPRIETDTVSYRKRYKSFSRAYKQFNNFPLMEGLNKQIPIPSYILNPTVMKCLLELAN